VQRQQEEQNQSTIDFVLKTTINHSTMSQREYALPRGSTVVVTGANGYIGSHVVDQLLELGFHVRGTIRSEKPWLDRLFEERHGKGQYESVIVPRMDVPGALDEAVKGATGLIHVVCYSLLSGIIPR
jgi:nucleoside-diphosphate-sugar epimerase